MARGKNIWVQVDNDLRKLVCFPEYPSFGVGEFRSLWQASNFDASVCDSDDGSVDDGDASAGGDRCGVNSVDSDVDQDESVGGDER